MRKKGCGGDCACALDKIHGGDASLACDSECYFTDEGDGTEHYRFYLTTHLGHMYDSGLVHIKDIKFPITFMLKEQNDLVAFKKLFKHLFEPDGNGQASRHHQWKDIDNVIDEDRIVVASLASLDDKGSWKERIRKRKNYGAKKS